MFCKECGKKIENDSKFCSFCGTKQSVIVSDFDTSIRDDLDTKNINVNLSFGRPKEIRNIVKITKVEKYDLTYEKEIIAIVVGTILIILNILILYLAPINTLSVEGRFAFLVFNIVSRIFCTIWVINIAKRQNRPTGGWGFFAFFFPNFALIIIGLLKKLNKNLIIKKYSNSQNDKDSTEKQELIEKNKKEEQKRINTVLIISIVIIILVFLVAISASK